MSYFPQNHILLIERSRTFGADHVDADCAPKLFSEDFAHMAAARPGCFILMGNGTDGANARPLHSADYDFCDDTLTIGASFWAGLVEQQLGEVLG